MILSMFFDLNESFLDSEAKGLRAENSLIRLLSCCIPLKAITVVKRIQIFATISNFRRIYF